MLRRKFSVPGVPELNASQILAVTSALQRPVGLIQGLPGMGKTLTAAAVAYNIVKHTNGKVLVCAPTANAVDKLVELIQSIGLKVVVVCSGYRESVQCLTIQHKVLKSCTAETGELHNLQLMKDEEGSLSSNDAQRYKQLMQRAKENEILMKGSLSSNNMAIYKKVKHLRENEILTGADVVCCTCVDAGDPCLEDCRFSNVLIDNCTQATEPECLIPLVHDVEKAILFGDLGQCPDVMSERVAQAGLSRSLFKRLVNLGMKPIVLKDVGFLSDPHGLNGETTPARQYGPRQP